MKISIDTQTRQRVGSSTKIVDYRHEDDELVQQWVPSLFFNAILALKAILGAFGDRIILVRVIFAHQRGLDTLLVSPIITMMWDDGVSKVEAVTTIEDGLNPSSFRGKLKQDEVVASMVTALRQSYQHCVERVTAQLQKLTAITPK